MSVKAGCHSDNAPHKTLPAWCISGACGCYPYISAEEARRFGCDSCDWKDYIPREDEMSDEVNHPSHYCQGEIECIDAIESACKDKPGDEAALVAPIIKYLWRYRQKDGIESLKKAQWYIDRLIERHAEQS